MNIIKRPSPNFNTGRNWQRVKKIVVHWIGAGTAESAVNWLTNPASQASAHYLVSGDTVWQMVEEKDTAWHAGNLQVNRESIGIEHDATPDRKATDLTYHTSAALIAEVSKRYDIPLDREHIIGHSSVIPTQCPGSMDIDRLIRLAKGENENDCEKRVEELEKEVEEIRDSRNKWRTRHEEDTDRLTKETSEKIKTIEAQQKQVATLNESLTIALGDKKTLLEQKKSLELDIDALRAMYEQDTDALEIQITALEIEASGLREINSKLSLELSDCRKKTKNKLSGYSRWELFKEMIWR